jgi:hypothetical protein
MRRIRRAFGLLLIVCAGGLALPSASLASCGLLGLWSCPQQDQPPSDPVNADGSLKVDSNPYNLAPLPVRAQGDPLYPREYDHLYFGLTDHAADEGSITFDEVAGLAEAEGASLVRLGLYWPSAESQRGRYTWSHFDMEYRTFIAHGLRPYWTIYFTPRWAAPAGAYCSGASKNYCDGEPVTREMLTELTTFGHNLARRYPLAAGFEYRNEPNLDARGKCTDDPSWEVAPEVYTRALLAFASGVHDGNPAGRVLGGSLSNCGWWDRFTKYLDAMLSHGAADGVDGISWHPYDETSDFRWFRGGLNDFAAVLRAHGADAMRLVASEVGYGTGSDAGESQRLRDEYMLLNTRDSSLDLVDNYDAFVGFAAVATDDKAMRPYGWVGRKDMFHKYPAKRVYCDFRDLLGLGRPLPSYVRDCMFG